MSIEIKVPQLPESVSDATIIACHKQVGDRVERDENLFDLETDKVVIEVPSPESGVLKEILVAQDEKVVSGQAVAKLEPGASGAQAKPAESKPAAAKVECPPAAASAATKLKPTQPPPVPDRVTRDVPTTSAGEAGKYLSPSLRRLMTEQGLSAEQAMARQLNLQAAAEMRPREEKRVPMSRLRQRVAERLLQVKQSTAMLTTFNEVDMHRVISMRTRHKDQFEKTYGVRLGFMSFFVRAAVQALKTFAAVNASIDGNDIVYHNYFDIGIAVSTERGLVVPVLRDVDKMSMADIEAQIRDYGERARQGKLALEELQGGNFTITNGGVFGSMLSTPILNPPQSAILGMHNIVERPVVCDGEIVIRPVMYLALSYDHRIVDGKESVQFLKQIKDALESPARLLLEL